eukprot:gb/GEZN01010688.1/.p1 GENE.gb/GEZN01010688.1/~~gb/GEZN01010688.1/.p1  ORF type:complete len:370 (+),score=38.84 gb/GEZN01010688.1/:38-1147(+)
MLLHRADNEVEVGNESGPTTPLTQQTDKQRGDCCFSWQGAALPFGVALCVSVCLTGIFVLLHQSSNSNPSDVIMKSEHSMVANMQSEHSKVANTYPISVPALKPGEWEKIRWADNNQVIHDNTRVVGLPPHMTPTLKEYIDRVGLTAVMRNLTGDHPLDPKTSTLVKLGDLTWFAQRPSAKWSSNMHWISPADEKTHLEYLRLLGRAGFDTVLQGLVDFDDNIKQLAAYQLTFIVVSKATEPFFHKDMKETRNKTFNVIIPIVNVPNSEPELLLKEDYRDGIPIGLFKYTNGQTAAAVGDYAYHSTSPVDYPDGEMRISSTVYISDIELDSVQHLRYSLTQMYPADSHFQEWVLKQAGAHCCGNRQLPH